MAQATGYPAILSIAYPDRPLSRLSTFFRPLLVIPILIVAALLTPLATAPPLLLLVFRRKYPRWWFDWNYELLKFQNRVLAYMSLMSDEYPSTDDDQYVHLKLAYPDSANDLNRLLPLVKWLLAIPHYVVLAVLEVIASVVVALAWLAILFTGRYPRALFNFMHSVMSYTLRVEAYMLVLVTDQYPPFSLSTT